MKAVRRTEKRRKSERAGRRSEWIAALFLRLKGYRILARRFRAQSGELDIVARKGRILAFVEVKARAKLDDAMGAVSFQGRRRIERAADMFAARTPHLADCDMRYDIIAISPRAITHLTGAWRYGE